MAGGGRLSKLLSEAVGKGAAKPAPRAPVRPLVSYPEEAAAWVAPTSGSRRLVTVETPRGSHGFDFNDGPDGRSYLDYIELPKSERGRGLGSMALRAAAQDAARRGRIYGSGSEVSPSARRVYEGMRKRGYDVTPGEGVDLANYGSNPHGKFFGEEGGPDVFTVKPPEGGEWRFGQGGLVKNFALPVAGSALALSQALGPTDADAAPFKLPRGTKKAISDLVDPPRVKWPDTRAALEVDKPFEQPWVSSYKGNENTLAYQEKHGYIKRGPDVGPDFKYPPTKKTERGLERSFAGDYQRGRRAPNPNAIAFDPLGDRDAATRRAFDLAFSPEFGAGSTRAAYPGALEDARYAAAFGTPDAARVARKAADRLTDPDFNVPRKQFNAFPLIAGGAGALAASQALAPGDAEAAPLKWPKLAGAKLAAEGPLAMDAESRMARARDMGFSGPWYHGTDQDISAFRTGQGWYGNGVYVTRDPAHAEPFTRRTAEQVRGEGPSGPNIMPLMTRGKLAPYEEFQALTKQYWPNNFKKGDTERVSARVQKELQRRGYDGVEAGGFDKEAVIYDPKNLRSPFAAFDPAKSDSSDLLAGLPLAIGGVAGATALSQSPDANAATFKPPKIGANIDRLLSIGEGAIPKAAPFPAARSTSNPARSIEDRIAAGDMTERLASRPDVSLADLQQMADMARVPREGTKTEIAQRVTQAMAADPTVIKRIRNAWPWVGGVAAGGALLGEPDDASAAPKLPMDFASRMARAREMGFDTSTKLYHGTGHKLGEADEITQFEHNPTWVSKNPEVADIYTGHPDMGSRGAIYPVFGRRLKPSVSDVPQAEAYFGSPNDFRSVHAAFDPAKRDSSDLLAGLAPLAIGGGAGLAALSQSPDASAATIKTLHLPERDVIGFLDRRITPPPPSKASMMAKTFDGSPEANRLNPAALAPLAASGAIAGGGAAVVVPAIQQRAREDAFIDNAEAKTQELYRQLRNFEEFGGGRFPATRRGEIAASARDRVSVGQRDAVRSRANMKVTDDRAVRTYDLFANGVNRFLTTALQNPFAEAMPTFSDALRMSQHPAKTIAEMIDPTPGGVVSQVLWPTDAAVSDYGYGRGKPRKVPVR